MIRWNKCIQYFFFHPYIANPMFYNIKTSWKVLKMSWIFESDKYNQKVQLTLQTLCLIYFLLKSTVYVFNCRVVGCSCNCGILGWSFSWPKLYNSWFHLYYRGPQLQNSRINGLMDETLDKFSQITWDSWTFSKKQEQFKKKSKCQSLLLHSSNCPRKLRKNYRNSNEKIS